MRISKVLALALLICVQAFSQVSRGTVKEGLPLDSKILGKPVRYTLYLPYDYETSKRYYPVVYLLHGYSDNDMGWIQFGEAQMIADEGIARRDIPPMILVMPDGGVSWYINNADNSVRYEDFFFQEFLPFIESHYRIRSEKQYRGISGLSMGGFGALTYALRHPDMFSACVAFSAAVFTDEEIIAMPADRWMKIQSVVSGSGMEGKNRITQHYKSYSPLHLAQAEDREKLKKVRFYVDCGDDDVLSEGNAMLHIELHNLGIPHEYRVRDGGHTWSYWRSGLPEGLKFIGTSFHQP